MTLRLLFRDQLSLGLSSLADAVPGRDKILLIEARDDFTDVPHHKQKIVLHLSAMRHFANALRDLGFEVRYLTLVPNWLEAAVSAVASGERVVLTRPTDWRDREGLQRLGEHLPGQVMVYEDNRFICPPGWFRRWSTGRREWRMEFFYREMRRLTGLLMDGKEPSGGRWNFDAENRARLPKEMPLPPLPHFLPDEMTLEVIDLVAREFPDHPGRLEGFAWPVTRRDAQSALEDFIVHRLPYFGDYQDAMEAGQPVLFHSLLAPALNLGLLTALEVAKAAEAAWRRGDAPINAVEGFIRQIIGWREFVRELYHATMPDYRASNALSAHRALPAFFWTGKTDLACLSEVITTTLDTAYAHHIQRLMITGNFALLAGLAPAEVEAWYLAVYADAFEWVELPNTHGMALYADGGRMASKPYAASAAYIHRMSNYCASCRYDPKAAIGDNACPFNALYWDFLMRNRAVLGRNPRLAMPYRTLDRFGPERQAALSAAAAAFLSRLDAPLPPQQMSLL